MKLHEIGIGNYRNIGDDPIWINLEKKVNIFIGANNSGKSNILRAFEFLAGIKKIKNITLAPIDIHQRDDKNLLRISLKGSFEEEDAIPRVAGEEFVLDFRTGDPQPEWLKVFYGVDGHDDQNKIAPFLKKFQGKTFTGRLTTDELAKYVNGLSEIIANELLNKLPPTHFIPQFRQITSGENYKIKGEGIIKMLASWQHPEITAEANTESFLKIQNLLRRLLNLSDLEIEVVHTRDQIIVKNNDLRLPLESYGTGVHELIILAAAVYSQENVFFLIEEPEIHLHPRLQKEFLNFIITETNNKYLITTHSNALIQPSEDVDVVHLRLDNGATKGKRVESSTTILDILHDLGISPSDILQANSVIWVEGPSDRNYINKWISLCFPDLKEGIDYSIMFYGGKLLSHLSLERDDFPDPNDLIPLLRINQKSIIVIDSDKKKVLHINVCNIFGHGRSAKQW